jgi:DNA-binding transcriptional regulator YiaG
MTVLGEQAIEQGEHVKLLQTLETELTRRQEESYNTPFIVVIMDEIHDIFDVEPYNKDTYRLLKKLRRLRKGGIMEVLTWHDSTKEGAGQLGTGLMSLNVSAFVVNSTKSKAAKVLESGDAEKAVNLEKGQAVLKLPGDDSETILLPFIQKGDLFQFLPAQNVSQTPTEENQETMIEDTPEPEHRTEEHITPEKMRQQREILNISQRKLAKETGVSQTKISDYENGKDRLSDEEKCVIHQRLFQDKESKTSNVINLNRFLKPS